MGEVDKRNCEACKRSTVPLLKFICVILGYIVLHLGLFAHLNSRFTVLMQGNFDNHFNLNFPSQCGAAEDAEIKNEKNHNVEGDPDCPYYAYYLEGIFIFISLVFFIYSITSLVTGFICQIPGSMFQTIDTITHFVGAGGLIFGGILMISSAEIIEGFLNPDPDKAKPKFSLSKELGGKNHWLDRYADKWTAGLLCICLGVLFAITGFVVLRQGRAALMALPGGTTPSVKMTPSAKMTPSKKTVDIEAQQGAAAPPGPTPASAVAVPPPAKSALAVPPPVPAKSAVVLPPPAASRGSFLAAVPGNT